MTRTVKRRREDDLHLPFEATLSAKEPRWRQPFPEKGIAEGNIISR